MANYCYYKGILKGRKNACYAAYGCFQAAAIARKPANAPAIGGKMAGAFCRYFYELTYKEKSAYIQPKAFQRPERNAFGCFCIVF